MTGRALVASDLTYRSDDGYQLGPLSFEIAPGGLTLLLGANGAGKSTLLRVLAGLLPVASGTLSGGMHHLPPQARQCAYVPQQGGLIANLRVRAQVALTANRRAAQAALDTLGIGALADAYPHQLSVGQKYLVALARAVACEDRQLFLLDEPFATLDTYAARTVVQLLTQLRACGKLLLVATHQIPPRLVADRLMVLAKTHACSRLLQTDTFAALCQTPVHKQVADLCRLGQWLTPRRRYGRLWLVRPQHLLCLLPHEPVPARVRAAVADGRCVHWHSRLLDTTTTEVGWHWTLEAPTGEALHYSCRTPADARSALACYWYPPVVEEFCAVSGARLPVVAWAPELVMAL